MITVGFLGGGNMAGAIITGLAKKLDPARIHVTDHHPEKLAALAARTGCQTHAALGSWVGECDLFILAVKPQGMKSAVEPLPALLKQGGAALSIAAGIEAAALKRWLAGYTVLRAMPNTPAMAGVGTTGLWAPADAAPEALDAARFVLSAVGDIVEVADEDGIDLVGAIPGSGPAYVFRFLEALELAGEKRGLPPASAKALALGTVYGAAVLAKQSGEDFARLREAVTSKGGTTAKALEVFNARGIDEMVDEAVEAALKRTAEMKALFR